VRKTSELLLRELQILWGPSSWSTSYGANLEVLARHKMELDSGEHDRNIQENENQHEVAIFYGEGRGDSSRVKVASGSR
jgi:hypothetical protein